MNEETKPNGCPRPGSRKHRMGRRARLAVAAVTLMSAGALLGAGVTAHAAKSGWHGMGHRWSDVSTEEQARERALDKAAWMLGRLDATPEQEARINAIVTALVADLYPLRAAHRETRRELVTELARPRVDRAALERIRAEGLALADTATRSVLDAVAEASEVLSVEQREELAAMIGRHRHRGG